MKNHQIWQQFRIKWRKSCFHPHCIAQFSSFYLKLLPYLMIFQTGVRRQRFCETLKKIITYQIFIGKNEENYHSICLHHIFQIQFWVPIIKLGTRKLICRVHDPSLLPLGSSKTFTTHSRRNSCVGLDWWKHKDWIEKKNLLKSRQTWPHCGMMDKSSMFLSTVYKKPDISM